MFLLTLGSDRWMLTRVGLKNGGVQPHHEVMRDPLDDQMFGSPMRMSRDGAIIAGTGNRTVSSPFLIERIR